MKNRQFLCRAKYLLCMAAVIVSCCSHSANSLLYSNYYFIKPAFSNLISGMVMGPDGDYKLVRYEDIAWLQEAYAERSAMASGDYSTNKVGRLIKGGEEFSWLNPTIFLDPYIELIEGQTFPNGFSNYNVNAEFPDKYYLIKSVKIKNIFAKVRDARRITPYVGWSVNHVRKDTEESDDASIRGVYDSSNHLVSAYITNTFTRTESTNTFYNIFSLYKSVTRISTTWAYAPWVDGQNPDYSVTVQGLNGDTSWIGYDSWPQDTFDIIITHQANTNAWLRGRSSPGWYSKASFFGLMRQTSFEDGGLVSEADAFIKFGDLTYVGAGENHLTWKVSNVSGSDINGRVAAYGGKTSAWVDGCDVDKPPYPEIEEIGDPAYQWDHAGWWIWKENWSRKSRSISLNFVEYYMDRDIAFVVFELTPNASIGNQ